MEIVNLFYELARQHKDIKGFRYGKGYEKGAGKDVYPLTWVDDPVTGQGQADNVIRYLVNVDILGIPKSDKEVLPIQSKAFNVGLSYREQIKVMTPVTGLRVESMSFISLRDYYDDKAAGYRFSYTVIGANPLDRCEINYDPNKELTKDQPLPEYDTKNANGCAVFNDKTGLPNFDV